MKVEANVKERHDIANVANQKVAAAWDEMGFGDVPPEVSPGQVGAVLQAYNEVCFPKTLVRPDTEAEQEGEG